MPTGFPRINAYVLIPNESGAVVAVIKEIAIRRMERPHSERHDELVDLPFPARLVIAIPSEPCCWRAIMSATHLLIRTRSSGSPVGRRSSAAAYACPAWSIVEAQETDRLIQIGTAPFAGNARVWVHPDKLFGRHLAILGNTGSGKSCSVAGIIRWSLEAATSPNKGSAASNQPNARFIILDPNGEYAEAFKDGTLAARRYAVGGADGAQPLTVPGWLWTGQEWAAFTSAQPGVQRPILLSRPLTKCVTVRVR